MKACATCTMNMIFVVHALWGDNNIVTTLSNYHPPEFLEADSGMLRKRKSADGSREKEHTMANCPAQNKDYSKTFHEIDKANLKAATHDLKGHSKKHNWSPKIVFRAFNINNTNAYIYYRRLVDLYTPTRRALDSTEGISELAHAFCQRGESMRKQRPEHPSAFRDISTVF